MKVGITYDLKDDYIKMGFSEEDAAEFDSIETIDGLDNALRSLGYETERIGSAKNLAVQLVAGKRWDIVFNIAEGVRGIGREAQVPAFLDTYDIPYVFSDPMVLALSLHKGMTKRVVRDGGIPTPKFHVVENEKSIDEVDLKYPLFAKPVSEGTGKGIDAASKITGKNQLREVCISLLKKHNQPVLVEEYLPGREFTVGIVGTGTEAKVVGVIEVLSRKGAEQNAYSLYNKKHYKEIIEYVPPKDMEMYNRCSQTALKAWNILGCRDGGRIDLRNDSEDIPNFIEVNPLAGLNLIDSDLPILCRLHGIEYKELIRMIMNSAVKRLKG